MCVWTWPTYAYTSHTCNHTNRIARYTLPKPTTCFKEIEMTKMALTCFNCSLNWAINSTPNSWISKLNSFSHTMCNVMVFSHAFVVFMHTYPKVAPNSLQKNLIRPNHTSPCLEFRKLFNVLLSRFGWEASRPAMRNMDRFPYRCISFSQWSREGARTPPLLSKYLWKNVIKKIYWWDFIIPLFTVSLRWSMCEN